MIATDVQNSSISVKMCDEIEHRPLLFSQPPQDVLEIDSPLGINTAGRLVQEQHLGVGHQRLGQHQPLPHASRQLDHQRLPLLGQAHHLEVPVDLRPPLARGVP